MSLGKNSNTTWAKSQSVTVTLKDSHSGLAAGAVIKYGWSTDKTTAPTYTNASIATYNAGAESTTFTATKSSGTGKFYLWVKVETLADQLGNSYSGTNPVKSTGTFYIDNTGPTISISPQENTTWAKSQSATITISDANAGLATGAKIKYGWSTSNSTAPTYTDATITGYSAGASSATYKVTKSDGTGKFYLWVQIETLKDKVDNAYSGTNPITTTGTFYIDNNAPTAGTLTMKLGSSSGSAYTSGNWTNQSVYVAAVNGSDGANESGHKSTTFSVTKNGSAFKSGRTSLTLTDAGTYVITVTTTDNAGNTASAERGTVKIDKTKPTISLSGKRADSNGNNLDPASNLTTSSHQMTANITITVADSGGSGMSKNALGEIEYQYKVVQHGNNAHVEPPDYGWQTQTSGAQFNIGKGSNGEQLTGKYCVWVRKVKDIAGNTCTSNGTSKLDDTTEYDTEDGWQIFGPYIFNQFTVTYNYSENKGTSATKTTAYPVASGASVDLTPTATRLEEWEFVGWNTNKEATTKLTSYTMPQNDVTLYAIFKKTLTATFYEYNNTAASTRSVTIYNTATSGSIITPEVKNNTVTVGTVTYDVRGYEWSRTSAGVVTETKTEGWSTSSEANASVNVEEGERKTISANTSYYASYYSADVATTFKYWNGSAQTTVTADVGARLMNYAGTTSNLSTTLDSAVIPEIVRNSTGPKSNANGTVSFGGTAVYQYVSTTVNGNEATTINPGNTYYAIYQITTTFTFKGYNNTTVTTKQDTVKSYTNQTFSKNSTSVSYNKYPGDATVSGTTYKGFTWSTATTAIATPTFTVS